MNRNDATPQFRSKDRKRKGEDPGKVDLTLTAMIDVTFQLLVFFMVTSDFTTLEGKIASYLPKDNRCPGYPAQELPVHLYLRWNPTPGLCKVYVGRVRCGNGETGVRRARRLVKRSLVAGACTALIDAGGDVPARWVIHVLNMLLEAGVPVVNFTGSLDPLGENK